MQLFNSTSQAVERFRPRPGRPVTLYVCGITPYDTTHLGHACTYVVFDVLVRHLEEVHRWPVAYVQNLTDIDDDVLRRAASVGEDWRDLGLRWTARFTTDMADLGVRPPNRYPAATAFVPEIQANVARLIEAGLGYERAGSVYYRVQARPGFGPPSQLPPDRMLEVANERGNVPDDPRKEHPLDFVLWQAGVPGEPAWDSPWGPGRPGWHIECSTMAGELLGDVVDIHGGGADLSFPHHACEVAQAEPLVRSRPWVRFWVHVAMVRKDGEKMSKSLGNLVLVRDLLARYPADAIRLYLLRHHYRAGWEWDPGRLDETMAWVRALWAAAARPSGPGPRLDAGGYGPRFTAALDDDLDTPAAVEAVLRLADDILAAPPGADLAAARDVLAATAGRVLGLWLKPDGEVTAAERQAVAWPAPETAAPDRLLAALTGQAG